MVVGRPGGGGKGGMHERDSKAVQRAARMHVAQGLNNNTTMSGMKHYKNQSLNF